MPNPINYDWSNSSLWADVVRISLVELIAFAPILLVILFSRLLVAEATAKA